MDDVKRLPWLRTDYRRDSLSTIVIGLKAALDEVDEKLHTISWYDGLWAQEEAEPIFGIAYIAMQNYINKSIADYESVYNLGVPKYRYYQLNNVKLNLGRTAIEMIVALANYAKHEEEGKLHSNTMLVLDDLGFIHLKPDITESPLFKGIELISYEWDLSKMLEIVLAWREQIWESKAFQ